VDYDTTLHLVRQAHRLVIKAQNSLGDNFQHALLKECPRGWFRAYDKAFEQEYCLGRHSSLEPSNFKFGYVGGAYRTMFIRMREWELCMFH
jgi:hypothetical protein